MDWGDIYKAFLKAQAAGEYLLFGSIFARVDDTVSRDYYLSQARDKLAELAEVMAELDNEAPK